MGSLLGTQYDDQQEKLILQRHPHLKKITEERRGWQQDAELKKHFQRAGDIEFGGKVGVADPDGRPIRPDFMSLVDPATGRLQSKFQLGDAESLSPFAEQQLSGINLNTQALEELRKRGLSTGPSEWGKLATGRQAIEELQAREEAQKQGDRQAASAWSQMAMRGGASGGERERIAMESAGMTRDQLANVGRQGQLDRYGIGLQDEQTRLGILQNLPGMEVQSLQPQFEKARLLGQAKQFDIGNKQDTARFNLGNLMADTTNRNNYNMGVYDSGMKEWAAKKTAQAQEEASRGGGISYLCTFAGSVEPWSEAEQAVLDSVKTESFKRRLPQAKFYFRYCESLVPKMREMGVDPKSLRPFVLTVIHYAKQDMEKALDFYWDYLVQVLNTYSPETFMNAAMEENDGNQKGI